MNTFHVYAHVYMYVGKALSKTYIFINVNIPWFCWGISIWNMPEIHLWTALLQAAAGFFPTAYFGFQDGKNRGGWCWSLKEEHFSDGLRETFPETLLRSSGWWFQIYFQNVHPEFLGVFMIQLWLAHSFFSDGWLEHQQRVWPCYATQVRLMRSFHPSCRWGKIWKICLSAWRNHPRTYCKWLITNGARIYKSPRSLRLRPISKWPSFMAYTNQWGCN